MKIVVVDGHGGRMGKAIIEGIKGKNIGDEIVAVGTNSAATATMLSAKADYGVTGENALIVNCRNADYIVGPIGIVVADSLHGEISPKMSVAIGQSPAKKILLPVSKCNTYVASTTEQTLEEYIELALNSIV